MLAPVPAFAAGTPFAAPAAMPNNIAVKQPQQYPQLQAVPAAPAAAPKQPAAADDDDDEVCVSVAKVDGQAAASSVTDT